MLRHKFSGLSSLVPILISLCSFAKMENTASVNVRKPPLISFQAGIFFCLGSISLLAACAGSYNPLTDYEEVKPATAIITPPADIQHTAYDPAIIEHGKYMVDLLGCANCHTDGALIGEPDLNRVLAGSHIGIAYSNPLAEAHPGIVYPANLTPDPESGMGKWSDDEIIRMIRSGVDRHGKHQLSVMPWPAYARVSDVDAQAIVAYLRSLTPVKHHVPGKVKRGEKATGPFVHFGMYRSQ